MTSHSRRTMLEHLGLDFSTAAFSSTTYILFSLCKRRIPSRSQCRTKSTTCEAKSLAEISEPELFNASEPLSEPGPEAQEALSPQCGAPGADATCSPSLRWCL